MPHFRFKSVFFLILLSINSLIAQHQRVYPAEKNNLWGFINAKGQWMSEPRFEDLVYHNNNIYLLAKRDSIRFDLWVFDTAGQVLLILKDTLQFNGQEFHIKGLKYYEQDISNYLSQGRFYMDSIVSVRKKDEQELSWMSDSRYFFRTPDSQQLLNQADQIYKLWYPFKGKKFGYLESKSEKVILANTGGYSIAKLYPAYGSRSMDYIDEHDARFETLEIKEGKWGLMNRNGEYTTTPISGNKNDFAFYYPDRQGLNQLMRNTHLAFVMITDKRNADSNRHFMVANNRGIIVFDEKAANSSYYKVSEEDGFYTIHFIRNMMVYQALTLDYDGKVLDTFQNITCNGRLKLCAVSKADDWGIMNYNHTMLTGYNFDYTGKCFPVNEQTIGHSKNDSEIIFIDLKMNFLETPVGVENITDSKGGYSIGVRKFVNSRNDTFYLINPQGKIIYKSHHYLSFEDSLKFSDTKGFKDIEEEIIKGEEPIYGRQSVNNAWRVENCFVCTWDQLIDTSFKEIKIAGDQIYQSVNELTILKQEYSDSYRLCLNRKKATKWLPYHPWILPERSGDFTMFEYQWKYFICFRTCGRFVCIENKLIGMPEIFGSLVKIRYWTEDNKEAWLYFNAKGQIVFNSAKGSERKYRTMRWRQVKLLMEGSKS